MGLLTSLPARTLAVMLTRDQIRTTLVSMGAVVLTQGQTNSSPVSNPTQWTEDMKALLAYQAWTQSVGRMETRADLIAVANSSVGRRCLLWNAYSDPLIPYPVRVVMPDDATAIRMLTAQRNAIQLGTPWCPLKALSALGIIHGVKRFPSLPQDFRPCARSMGSHHRRTLGASTRPR